MNKTKAWLKMALKPNVIPNAEAKAKTFAEVVCQRIGQLTTLVHPGRIFDQEMHFRFVALLKSTD